MTRANETPKQAARRLAASAIRNGFKPQALHEYHGQDGMPLFWRIRLKHPDSGEKWIRPMKLNGQGYVLGEPEYPNGKPLYHLDELTARPADGVFVVEGETCADALAKPGLLTTTSGGAGSAEKADWSILSGRSVTIWPDNDEAGRHYAEAVADILLGLGCTVRMMDVAALNLPPKGDAVDWLAIHASATAEDISALPRMAMPGPLETHQDTQAAEGMSPTAPEQETPPDENPTDDKAALEWLSTLSPLEYDRVRKEQAKALGVRESTLDKMVADLRRDSNDAGLDFADVDPWPDPIQPAALLSEVADTVVRFIICQPETAHAVALWVAMTWLMDVVQVAPLAIISAPEKRCGKSLLLFLLGRLSYRPLTASNITPAALFRAVDAWRPTLLVDEADAFVKDNEELRGLLNCGHTRDSAYIVRVVGENYTPTRFNVWGAKALAGIGHLADTLMDRAVTLELRRKLPHESVERLRYAEPGLFDDLAAKLARFAEDHRDAVRRARPELPASLNDRAQDNWEPLLAIADVAGGQWPAQARKAALKLSGVDSPTMSIGTELLADIQEVFEHKRVDRISTADLIAALCDDDEKPWATYNRGKPLNPRQLSRRLAEYGIKSTTIRINYGTAKGYLLEWFEEAFSRYLASPPSTSVTASQPSNDGALRVTDRKNVTVTEKQSVTLEGAPPLDCYAVTDTKGACGGNGIIEVEV